MGKLDTLLSLKSSLIKNIGSKIDNKEIFKIQILPLPIGSYDAYNDVNEITLQHCEQNNISLGIFYVLKDKQGQNHWISALSYL